MKRCPKSALTELPLPCDAANNEPPAERCTMLPHNHRVVRSQRDAGPAHLYALGPLGNPIGLRPLLLLSPPLPSSRLPPPHLPLGLALCDLSNGFLLPAAGTPGEPAGLLLPEPVGLPDLPEPQRRAFNLSCAEPLPALPGGCESNDGRDPCEKELW